MASKSEEYVFDDSYPNFQYDYEDLPLAVKRDLEQKREFLKKDPFRESKELRGKYRGKHKMNLLQNYRYVFRINIHSNKIYSYEIKPRSKSYKQ